MDADSIKIECEEDGFYLALELDENLEEGTYRIFARITDPEAFYDHVKAAILPWLMERDDARQRFAEMSRAEKFITGDDKFTRRISARTFSHPDRVFECTPDESGGYDISDPKHPDFHSVHADIWDSRAGK